MQIIKKILVSILTFESKLVLKKYRPFVIAVTGSVGKTSAKDAIYSVLQKQSRYVRKSQKSLNSEIGLPLTIIGVPNAWHDLFGWLSNIATGFRLILFKNDFPDCLILEVGADHPNDIKKVAKWLRPDIAVITKVSRMPVHVEFFKSPEEVFEEKASLARNVKKGGTAILFFDDEKVMSLKGELESVGIKVTTYGMNEGADVRGTAFGFRDKEGLVANNFFINIDGQQREVSFNNPLGKTGVYPLLVAASVGLTKKVPLDSIIASISNCESPIGRMNVIQGINETVIIDDTYNSSPDAAYSALETLRDVPVKGRRVAVLGDMLELGKYASDEHRKIGKHATHIADVLITVGPRSHLTADEAIKSGFNPKNVVQFDTSTACADQIISLVMPGDMILVKGSQSIRMERVVKVLLKEPEKAARLLVRQEKEWLDKK